MLPETLQHNRKRGESPITTSSLDYTTFRGARRARRDLSFRGIQVLVWTAYAVMLTIPWIGTYTVVSMIPNKIAIAGSGALLSTLLRALYRASLSRGSGVGSLTTLAVTGSVVAGIVWSFTVAVVVSPSTSHQLLSFGALDAGVPHLSGSLYHALVLLTWSFAYIAITTGNRVSAIAAESRRRIEPHAPVIHPDLVADERITIRDGARVLMLDPAEIDWIKAEGDYIRVQTGAKGELVRGTMKSMESILPTAGFKRIHRSAIVNLSSIRELIALPNRECSVVLRNGTTLKASRSYAGTLTALHKQSKSDTGDTNGA